MIGPEPPEATELTREERRFFRYDRNRDRRITRTEMLSTRTDAFRKLDVDGVVSDEAAYTAATGRLLRHMWVHALLILAVAGQFAALP